MKNYNYLKTNFILGSIIAFFIFVANVAGCFAQGRINQPLSESVKFNESVVLAVADAELQQLDSTENVSVYNYKSTGGDVKVIYYHKNGQTQKIAVKATKEIVSKVFATFNPEAGKQFVIVDGERIYIEKQTETTWALFITKK